jgi:hypothetical protein
MASAFEDMSKKFLDLSQEINAFVLKLNSKKDSKEDSKKDGKEDNKRIFSNRSVEPMNRLRKNEDEVKQSQESPEIQFILDKISDIFK